MKLLFPFLFLLSSAFAATSETFRGEEIVINGFRVSARKHWNFRAYATPDYKFCSYLGFHRADRSTTLVTIVPPQRMVFFTALLSEDPHGIEVLDDETKMLERVTCVRD